MLALAEILRDEADVLDELVDSVLEGRDARSSWPGCASSPPALQRLVVQRLADEAAGGPGAGVARRAEEIAASEHGTAALDLPHGVRADVREGCCASGGRRRTRPGRNGRRAAPCELDGEHRAARAKRSP